MAFKPRYANQVSVPPAPGSNSPAPFMPMKATSGSPALPATPAFTSGSIAPLGGTALANFSVAPAFQSSFPQHNHQASYGSPSSGPPSLSQFSSKGPAPTAAFQSAPTPAPYLRGGFSGGSGSGSRGMPKIQHKGRTPMHRPPRVSDLEKLRKLKADIEAGIHPIYKPVTVSERAERERLEKEQREQEEAAAAAAAAVAAAAAEAVVEAPRTNDGRPLRPQNSVDPSLEEAIERKIRLATKLPSPDLIDQQIAKATQRVLEMMERGEPVPAVNPVNFPAGIPLHPNLPPRPATTAATNIPARPVILPPPTGGSVSPSHSRQDTPQRQHNAAEPTCSSAYIATAVHINVPALPVPGHVAAAVGPPPPPPPPHVPPEPVLIRHAIPTLPVGPPPPPGAVALDHDDCQFRDHRRRRSMSSVAGHPERAHKLRRYDEDYYRDPERPRDYELDWDHAEREWNRGKLAEAPGSHDGGGSERSGPLPWFGKGEGAREPEREHGRERPDRDREEDWGAHERERVEDWQRGGAGPWEAREFAEPERERGRGYQGRRNSHVGGERGGSRKSSDHGRERRDKDQKRRSSRHENRQEHGKKRRGGRADATDRDYAAADNGDDDEDEEDGDYDEEEEQRRYEEEMARYYKELEEYERKKAARAADKRARAAAAAAAAASAGVASVSVSVAAKATVDTIGPTPDPAGPTTRGNERGAEDAGFDDDVDGASMVEDGDPVAGTIEPNDNDAGGDNDVVMADLGSGPHT